MLRPIILKLGLSWLGSQFRAIAEGKHGAGLQRAYLWLQGKKRALGIALVIVCAALVGAGQTGAAVWITGTLGPLLLSLGLIDAQWRETSLPATLEQYTAYRLLRDHSADIAALVGVGAAWVSSCDADTTTTLMRIHLTCHHATVILAAISGVLVQLGLMAEAKLSPAPRV